MTRSIWGAVRLMMYEMTVLLPLLLVVLVGFLAVLTWATAQSGAIPLGIGITNMLGVSDLPAAIDDIPREFTTTIEILGRSIGGLTIGF
jgi:hypothetical protein